ncbi:hypothetical protein H2201_008441 [Coniosporium apollinis]|uniref:Uncharacterized protein n=1 Tax=Coniosporium apollinis TaxID=61459 RepID=A0ABQ9NJI9_9PEZI|nr:hypothetical protein H2201_008441 [Coniosporium apollinis]
MPHHNPPFHPADALLRWHRTTKLSSPSSINNLLALLSSTTPSTLAEFAKAHHTAAAPESARWKGFHAWICNRPLCAKPPIPSRASQTEAAEAFLALYHTGIIPAAAAAAKKNSTIRPRRDSGTSSPIRSPRGLKVLDPVPDDPPRWWAKASEQTLCSLAWTLSLDPDIDEEFRACLEGDLAAFKSAMGRWRQGRVERSAAYIARYGESRQADKSDVRWDQLATVAGWAVYRLLEASGEPEVVWRLKEEERRVGRLEVARKETFEEIFPPIDPPKPRAKIPKMLVPEKKAPLLQPRQEKVVRKEVVRSVISEPTKQIIFPKDRFGKEQCLITVIEAYEIEIDSW